MYVEAILKCPEYQTGEWLAVTRVGADGTTHPLGYLPPGCVAPVVETLRPLLARVPEEGHPSGATVEAWENFVHWATVVAGLAPAAPAPPGPDWPARSSSHDPRDHVGHRVAVAQEAGETSLSCTDCRVALNAVAP